MDMKFQVFTGALRAYTSPDGVKRLSTTASSTVTDHYGDNMEETAIRSMARTAFEKSMTIFLNHDYDVPEDVFGKTVASRVEQRGFDEKGAPIWDLDLDIDVDETNPRAMQTYRSLRGPKDDGNGVKLGVSIGALIKDYELKDKADPYSALRIKDVELLEASIVGIPANPRSWVKSAREAYKASLKERESAKVDVSGFGNRAYIAELVQNVENYEASVEPEAAGDPLPPDPLPEGPVKPEIARAAAANDDDEDDRQDGDHQHPHAHAHDHEHSHGYGDNQTTHSHDHAHMHSHDHADGHHGSADDQADYQHDHFHDGADGDHAHDHRDSIEPAVTEIVTDKSVTPEEQPAAAELPVEVETPDPSSPETDAVIERAVDEAIDTLASLVREQRQSLSERDAQIVSLTRERDDAVASLRLAMSFVEKLARTPLGKRTQFAAPISDFRTKFAGIYDDEFLQYLDKDKP